MKKWTLINKKTNLPIKVSTTFIEGDCGEIFFFTESKNGFYWIVDTEEEANKALEPYVSYIYNSNNRPYFDNLNPNDYKLTAIEINFQ